MGYLRLVKSGPAELGGDADCLGAFDRELDYLFALLQRFGARSPEIEDLLQEVFVVLHRHWPTLDRTRPLRPWLFTVAFRVVRAARRRTGREVLADEIVLQDPGPDPEAELQDRESLALFFGALERVPVERRTVVVLHDIEGVEVAEIARRLAMTRIGVYSRLYKGRKELGSALRRLRRAVVRR